MTHFWETFHDNFIFTLRVLAWSLLRGNRCVHVYAKVWTTTLLPISQHTQLAMHTYTIGQYNPSVRIIDLVSHNTYVVCVYFIQKWRDLRLKVNSERQIFWETSHDNFIYSQSFCQKSVERKSPKKIIFVFCFDVWLETRTLAFRLISKHITY